MARKDKAGIYVDSQMLFEVLYKAQFEMPKKDRCVIAVRLLDHCEKLMAEFSLSYREKGNEKMIHIRAMLAEYEMLKMECRFIVDNGLIRNPSTDRAIKEYIVRIDEGIEKWIAYISSIGKQQGSGGLASPNLFEGSEHSH